MTDIVEWLRGIHASRERLLETDDFECLFKEAATELERLRKDKRQIAECAARLESELYAVLTERNVQADEIMRLRAKIERWEAQSIAQYAEIGRLRAALEPTP